MRTLRDSEAPTDHLHFHYKRESSLHRNISLIFVKSSKTSTSFPSIYTHFTNFTGKSEMVVLAINGIQVDFPYAPYPPQIRYMSSVIESLRAGHNALLESPTGTGKTLCLLCAALAWRATYVAALQAYSHARPGDVVQAPLLAKAGLQPPKSAASALAALVHPDVAPQLSAPRIVFSSRTHSQLAQAVAELKKTTYKPAMVQLASRDQLCVHDIASNMRGSRLNAMCRRITAPSKRGCRYYLPVASNREHENRCDELVEKLYAQLPMDIEELKEFGDREAACPYFLSRAAVKADSCEILFLPYNYLLDRSVRGSLGIDWCNDIIIIDEAHNLESVCSESMSFDLTDSVRKACDSELSSLIQHAVRPSGLEIPALEQLAKTAEGLDKVIGSENCELQEIRLMRSIMMSIEEFVTKVALTRGEENGVAFSVFPGGELKRLFKEAGGPTEDTYELFLEMLDRAMGVQADKTKSTLENSDGQKATASSSGSSGGSAIKILQSAIRVLFESFAGGHEKWFRTVVQQLRSNPSSGRTISYWCFKPAVAMTDINRLNMRCMLLTSGTLSPMDSFASELGIEFPVRLENPHVVSQPQIWARVVKVGPDHEGVRGGRLTSAFHARGEAAHMELGRTMIKIASITPDGLLVFFPSYGSMYTCIDAWKRLGPGVDGVKPSVWEHLLRYKRIVAEERESSKFAAAVLAHRTNIDARVGSILLAVCRGKVSEGIDFSDEYGRAVLITGLPYPSAFDPKVVLKREIADEEARTARQGGTGTFGRSVNQVMNGSQWYTTQAVRAVNQAVGRAIRHKYDYGAIILCDERYQSKNLQSQISKWIRPNLSVCPTFRNAETSLGAFFTQAMQSSFAKEGERKRLEARKQRQEHLPERKIDEDANAVRVAQEVITSFLPPPKTENQFLAQILSLSDEMKVQKLSPSAAKKIRETSLFEDNSSQFRHLDFGSESAECMENDSGSLWYMNAPEMPQETDDRGKWSSQFFAERTKREKQQGNDDNSAKQGRMLKRMRTAQETKRGRSLAEAAEAKEPFSKRIKKLFADTVDVREFLKLFREILRLQGRLRETVENRSGKGSEAGRCETEAKKVIAEIVRFSRAKAKNGSGDDLLRDLRCKIPKEFQKWYDEALAM